MLSLFSKSLNHRIILSISIFVAVSMVMVAATVLTVVGSFYYEELKHSRLETVAKRDLDLLEQKVFSLRENIKEFSHNHFVINGLIDPAGREIYLPQLIRSFCAKPEISDLIVLDFSGKPIFSNSNFLDIGNFRDELHSVLSVGQAKILNGRPPKTLIVAEPIEYYQTPQGAVIVELDLPFLAKKEIDGDSDTYKVLYVSGESIFAKNFDGSESYFSLKIPAGPTHPLIQSLGIEIEVGIPREVFLKPIYFIAWLLLIGTLLLMGVAFYFARHLGLNVSRPIMELCRRVELSETNDFYCSPLGTGDELEALALAFDKRSEGLLTAQENYRYLFEKNPLPMWVCDLTSFRFLAVNDAAIKHYGYNLDDFLQMTVMDVFLNIGIEFGFSSELICDIFNNNGPFKNIKNNGEFIWVKPFCEKINFQEVESFLMVVKDVSNEYVAEQSLVYSEKKSKLLYSQFSTILNGIHDPISLLDLNMKIIWANKAYTKGVGLDSQEVLGQFCFYLWHGRDDKCINCPVVKCLETKQIEEGKIHTGDGKIWEIKAFPMTNINGDIVNVIEMASEITQKIRLQRESEQASRLVALGEIVVGVAHEINNPSAVLFHNVKILENYLNELLYFSKNLICDKCNNNEENYYNFNLIEEILEILDDINGSNAQLNQIVKDLKAFGRMEPIGSFELYDINEIINTSLRLLRNQIKQHTDNFEVILSPSLPKIMASFQQMEQVIINLILNACQALPDKRDLLELQLFLMRG